MSRKTITIFLIFLLTSGSTFAVETLEATAKEECPSSGPAGSPDSDNWYSYGYNYYHKTLSTLSSPCFLKNALRSVAIAKVAGFTASVIGAGTVGPAIALTAAGGYLTYSTVTGKDCKLDEDNGPTININLVNLFDL